MHPFLPNDVGWTLSSGDRQLIALGLSDSVEVWQLNDDAHPTKLLSSEKQDHQDILHSLAPLPGNCLAAGSNFGAIHFYQAQDDERLHRSTVFHGSTASCVDMRYCAATKRLYTMHDCTFLMVTPAGQRNALQAVDVETKTVVATAHEFSEQYELICMAPLGGHGDWGNELVAGAVHGSFCTKCYHSGLPSLCHHKPGTATAALCVFDLRSGTDMVQRFGTHHRSLYPHMCCARGTYIFTSHVGKPLCVYDKRSMSMPVWEEEQLGNYSRHYPESMPLPEPTRPSEHNGMYLDVDEGGDMLVGRAANGMMWLWDLTATLGWQASADTALGQGSWLHRSSAAPWENGSYFSDWPRQLGAWRCEGCLPETHIHTGSGYHLIGLCSKRVAPTDSALMGVPDEDIDYVACARLV
ncbi:hypothetical protein COCOBI_10-1610 [Coccomyxa sp. Obi]|nr:hypothetical protein COCOBI_10-1610 [Coccomyxa sp. Obi]